MCLCGAPAWKELRFKTLRIYLDLRLKQLTKYSSCWRSASAVKQVEQERKARGDSYQQAACHAGPRPLPYMSAQCLGIKGSPYQTLMFVAPVIIAGIASFK